MLLWLGEIARSKIGQKMDLNRDEEENEEDEKEEDEKEETKVEATS